MEIDSERIFLSVLRWLTSKYGDQMGFPKILKIWMSFFLRLALPPLLGSCSSTSMCPVDASRSWVVELFLAEKCRWTWVTLSPGFSESGSPEVAWRRRSARVRTSHVLHMYCTCQRRALGWGVGGVNRNIQGIVHYASMISINKTMCDFDLSWCTVQVSYLTVILGVTVSPNLGDNFCDISLYSYNIRKHILKLWEY